MVRTKMPAALSEVFGELWQDVVWVHGKWAIFCQLYAEKDSVELLNNTAPSFFRICQDVLLDDVLLTICRITDPAQTGRKTNLCLERLVRHIDESAYCDLKDNATSLLTSFQQKLDFARDHRNRRIAHIDLQTRLKRHPTELSSITRQRVREALQAIDKIMNTIEYYFGDSTTL